MRDKEAQLIWEAMSRRDFLDRLGKGIATVSKLSGLQLPDMSTPAAAISPDAPYVQSLFNVEDGRLNHELSGLLDGKHIAPKLDSLTALPGGVFVDNNLPNKQGYIYFPEDMLWAGVDPEIRRAAKGYSLRYDVAAGKPVGWGGHQTHRPSIIELVDKLLYKIFGQLPQTDPADQQANQDDPSSDSTRKPRGGQPRIGAPARFSMPIVYDPDYDPDWGYPESKQRDKEAKLILEAMSRRDFLDRLSKGIAVVSKLSGLQLPTTTAPAPSISPDARYIESHFYVLGSRLEYYASSSMRTYEKHIAPNLGSLTTAPAGVFVDNSLFDKLSSGERIPSSQRRGSIYFPYSMLEKWTETGKTVDAAMDDFLLTIFGQPPMTPRQLAVAKKAREERFAKAQAQDAQDTKRFRDGQRKERQKKKKQKKKQTFPKHAIYDPDYDPDWGYPESKQLTFKQFFTEADGLSAQQGGMSRRDFLGKLGKGASMAARVVNLPWMKLFSAPELARRAAAPFMMGANKVINPLQMYQVFLKRITSQWNDQGVAFDNQPPYKSPLVGVHVHTIPDFVVQYVAKNMLEYTANNYEYTDDAAQHFLTDILDELDKGKQHVLDDPWVPQYIKDDVAANYHEEEEGVPSGDIENLNHDNIVGALYLSPEKANNWELLDHNIEDSLLRALGSSRDNWTRAYEEGEGSPMLSSILDYIEDLILPRAKFDWDPDGEKRQVSAEDVVKMDFKSQILPGTVNWLRAMKVQSVIDTQRFDQDAAKHRADKETDARNKDYLNRRPGFPELPDHGREWESKKIKTDADLIFEAYSEADMSRRNFLGMVGKGLSFVSNIPWTKLIAAPQLAAKAAAPFLVKGTAVINPQVLYKAFWDRFVEQGIETGLTPVYQGIRASGQAFKEDEMPMQAFQYVAQHVVEEYLLWTAEVGEGIAPPIGDIVSDYGEDELMDNRYLPQYVKDVLKLDADDESTSDEEYQRRQQIMAAHWIDPESIGNYDYMDNDVEETLFRLTGIGDRDNLEDPIIDHVFDHYAELLQQGMTVEQISQLDFTKQFLPGVVNMVKQQAADIARQRDQRASDAERGDDERGEVPSRHPYGVGSPRSALQTASTKPTFKEFFNKY